MRAIGRAASLAFAGLAVLAATRGPRAPAPGAGAPPFAGGAQAPAAEAPILAGAASRVITPEVGGAGAPVSLAGSSEGRIALKVRDDLYARALVLEAGGGSAAIVALDLYGLGRGDVQRMREEIRARAPDAARAGILIACTRTHAAPDATGQFESPGGSVDSAWLGRVRRAAAEAVEDAWRLRQPARLSFASARLPHLVTDARRPLRIDDQALLLRVESAEGRVGIAAVAVFGASPETLGRSGREVSSDYPGEIRRALEQAFGGVGFFLIGASGGLMLPVPPPAAAPSAGSPGTGTVPPPAPSFGEAVARALVVAWSGRLEATGSPARDATRAALGFRSRTVEIPLDNVSLRDAVAMGRRRARLTGSGGLESEVAVLSLASGGAPFLDLACIPGEIYPELVDGGIQEPQDPAADRPGEPAERPLRSLLRAPLRLVAGACGDDLGDIIPISEWDARAPFAYGQPAPPHGEETSPGARTAPILMTAFAELLR